MTQVDEESKGKLMGPVKAGLLASIARAGAIIQVCQETLC